MEGAPPLVAADDVFGCTYLRWATTDGGEDESQAGRYVKKSRKYGGENGLERFIS